jgi:hypothetical protein
MPDDSPDRPAASLDAAAALAYDVFVSYSSRDAAWARGDVLRWLEAQGYRVCIDFRCGIGAYGGSRCDGNGERGEGDGRMQYAPIPATYHSIHPHSASFSPAFGR